MVEEALFTVQAQSDERMLVPLLEDEEQQEPDFDQLYSQIDAWQGSKRAFLICLRLGGSARQACKHAHIARTTYRRWKKIDPLFVLAYDAAKIESAERLVEEARRRAVEGVERVKPIFWQGNRVGEERWREYDGKLLQQLIQAEAGDGLPQKYKPTRKVEVDGRITHLHELAEGAKEDQAEFDRQLAEGEIEGEVREM